MFCLDFDIDEVNKTFRERERLSAASPIHART